MFFCAYFLGTYALSFSPPLTLLLCLQASVKGGDQPLCNLCLIAMRLFALLQCSIMLYTNAA